MAMQVLDVYMHNIIVGKLVREKGLLSFTYDDPYIHQENAPSLSASLPLQGNSFDHVLTSAFFSGLLPEDIVRQRIARKLQISEENSFGLLEQIGGECAGAVSVYPEGIKQDTTSENTYKILNEDDAYDIMSQLDKRPLMAGEDDIRISGAGVQDKLIVAIVKGQLAIPLRNTPSTHIIKPKIQDLDETVQNEFFCMRLAQAAGLPVPDVEIFYLKDEPFYLVERYDRIKHADNSVTRLHQEDICQALHIPPEQKYENEGGPSLRQCFDLLERHIKEGRMAGINRMLLLQGVIFNFLIGNGDAHGKNFSILYEGEGERLAPFYDLLCTKIYGHHFKSRMAMKIGGKYKFRDVAYRHFEKVADENGFKGSLLKAQTQKLVKAVSKQAPKIAEKLNQDKKTASPVYDKIIQVINQQTEVFILT